MSTPVVPGTPITLIQAKESWLKQHERIIIAFFVLSLGIWGFNKWVDVSANNAKIQASISAQAQLAQDTTVKQLQAQMASQAQQFAQSQAEMKAEVLSLVSAIAQRDAKTAQQIQVITQPKTPTQAVADLTTAYPKLPDAPAVTEGGATVTTADIQQFTVAKIEGDTAKADLDDTKTELTATDNTLAQAVSLLSTKDTVIVGLQTDIKSHDKACEDSKKQLKKDARRDKWHSFLYGAATVGALALKFMKF
jgi:hypothetical protein